MLQAHIEVGKALHHQDLEAGFGAVYVPDALARKYPKAVRETGWQQLFSARVRSADPSSGQGRGHLDCLGLPLCAVACRRNRQACDPCSPHRPMA
jgi:hypothetical protein